MKQFISAFFFLIGGVFSLSAQAILPLKERAQAIEKIQEERFTSLLPQLMEAHQIDAWVLITREYNEDPVVTRCVHWSCKYIRSGMVPYAFARWRIPRRLR